MVLSICSVLSMMQDKYRARLRKGALRFNATKRALGLIKHHHSINLPAFYLLNKAPGFFLCITSYFMNLRCDQLSKLNFANYCVPKESDHMVNQ